MRNKTDKMRCAKIKWTNEIKWTDEIRWSNEIKLDGRNRTIFYK